MNVNLRVVAFLLSFAAAIFAAVLGVSLGAEEYLLPSLVLAVFSAFAFISYPQIAAFGAVATFSCGLTLPGLPGQMNLFDLFAAVLIGIFVLQVAMNTHKRIPFSRLEWLQIAYIAWILFIGAYRGFGFLAFGSDKIGGFNYLHLLLAASLVFTLPRISLGFGMWKPLFLVMGLLAPISLIADLLVTQGYDFGLIRLFVQTSSDIGHLVDESTSGGNDALNRLLSAGPAATAMLLALLSLVPGRKFFRVSGVPWLVAYAAIFTLSLLSGFRLMTAALLLTTAIVLFIEKQITAPRIALLLCVASSGLIGIYSYARQFPNSVQRAISWLPGINVSNAALGDATGTVDWRLAVWQESLRYIPDYWLVGKGFSYNLNDMLATQFDPTGVDWALTIGSYHNGWISMLLCTGALGLLLSLPLLILPVIHHWKRQRANWNNATLQRFHGVFLAAQITSVLVFVTVYGDVHVSFPMIFFQWAVLECLSISDNAAAPQFSESEEFSESIYQEA